MAPLSVLLALSLLAGCGGGGGGDTGAPVVAPTALGISSSNRDEVARTTVSALTGLALSDVANNVLPASAGSGLARAARTGWLPGPVLATLRAAVLQPTQRAQGTAGEGQARALAVQGPFTDTCALGGTIVSTLNDADNSNSLTTGDSMTLVYNNCRLGESLSLNGQYEVSYVNVTLGNTPSVAARITMVNFSSTEGADVVTLNGRMRLDHVVRSSTRADTTLSTETDLTVQARVGSRSDTVTLQAGYSTVTTVEDDVAPPEGGFAGRATLTAQGTVVSTALGGSLVLSTPAPLVAYFVDDYPRSGSVLATGRSSSLRLTAVSSTQVRLDLDSNGDGTVDSSSTVPWSSLE